MNTTNLRKIYNKEDMIQFIKEYISNPTNDGVLYEPTDTLIELVECDNGVITYYITPNWVKTDGKSDVIDDNSGYIIDAKVAIDEGLFCENEDTYKITEELIANLANDIYTSLGE